MRTAKRIAGPSCRGDTDKRRTGNSNIATGSRHDMASRTRHWAAETVSGDGSAREWSQRFSTQPITSSDKKSFSHSSDAALAGSVARPMKSGLVRAFCSGCVKCSCRYAWKTDSEAGCKGWRCIARRPFAIERASLWIRTRCLSACQTNHFSRSNRSKSVSNFAASIAPLLGSDRYASRDAAVISDHVRSRSINSCQSTIFMLHPPDSPRPRPRPHPRSGKCTPVRTGTTAGARRNPARPYRG